MNSPIQLLIWLEITNNHYGYLNQIAVFNT